MATPYKDTIKVAIRVRPLIKRENDLHQNLNWKVNKNTISQVSNGKLLANSSYIFDRIFDTNNTTQDVYNEFGRPIALSAMDGFNGTIFAYGQTSSGKTYTMMGDQSCEGVIPKAVGEIYDYIEKHPSREFLIRVSYMEIYNEDIRDLLNPVKTNLKIHENTQRQVYVGELTEEVVSCAEDVFKHMLRGEKNRHFGETNMNERSSRSHTIFRVVIESREMMDESKDRDTIDGAVRVAHLNLVDLAGSERASQTGAVGQRLKEGGHINKSLLALGSVIAKLSEGESFVPFRDSKLTRILQSSLGGNAKTSMICTITPAAVEETISTLKFASRAKTVKNCPEVNEVLDDGTLLKRYRKEISELKKQLTQMSQQSTSLHLQELQVEKEKMAELLEQHKKQQCEQEDRIKKLCNMICSSTRENEPRVSVKARIAKRRETWCPGPVLSKNPLASAAAFAEQIHISPVSPESDEDGFDGISKDSFLSMLNAEEKKKCPTRKERRVCFTSPQIVRCLSPIRDEEEKICQEIQTEPDERLTELQQEVKRLRKDLNEAISERDFFNRLLEESNSLIEKMSDNGGPSAHAQSLEVTLKYVSELRKEKSDLEEQVSSLQNQCSDLEAVKAQNEELEDKAQSLENELTLTSEYLTELQSEYDGVQAKNQTLSDRVEELESTETLNASVKAEMDTLKTALEERSREKEQLMIDLDARIQKSIALEEEIQQLHFELASKMENSQHQENACNVSEDLSFKTRELEMEIRRLQEELHKNVSEKENEVNELVMRSRYMEENFELLRREKENEISELAVRNHDLEENFALFREEKEKEISEFALKNRDIEETFALFRLEKEKEISELALKNRDSEENFEFFKLEKEKEINKLALKNRDIEENIALFRKEKENELNDLNLKFERFKEKKQLEINELQARNCENENKLEPLKQEKENESLTNGGNEENVELFREEKGNEIEETEDKCELVEQEKEIKEGDQRNSETGRQKENETTAICGVKELFDKATNTEKDGRRSVGADAAMEVDLKAKMSNLEVELERKTSQYEELEKLLDRVKKERDEIKNDLSETITDTAELQQELLGMQQKVKRYKEHIHEMEEEQQELETCVTTHQKQVEDLTKQLSLAREELELASNYREQMKQLEQNEDEVREAERLVSLLEEEKTRVQEISEERDMFRSKAEKLQERVATLENEASARQKEACELQEKIRALENDMSEFHQQRSDSEKLCKEEKEKYNALAKEFEKLKGKVNETSEVQGDLCYQLELQKSKKEIEELTRDLVDEKKAHEILGKDYTSLSEELQQLKNSFVQDRNRGMNQQRVIDKMKEERRETICSQAAQRQEMEKELQEAIKRVSDLESQCSYLRSEKDLMEHRLEVANKKAEETKQEMRDMENLYSFHDTRAVTQIDDQKATQKMKQLEFNMDLTKQKLEKADKRVKELESENRQLSGADIRNGLLTEERENLKNQLQQAKKVLDEKSKKLNELSIDVTQLKAHVEKLSDEKKKNRSAIEKKDTKIDELEEKLWAVQELLRTEQENTKDQKAQSSMLDELNSTIRVKHEELEHMTFLVDEREVEIAEIRSSLKENELKHGELQDTILQNEQRVYELESKLTDANSKLLETTAKLNEAERRIAELEEIVQRSYADKASSDGQMEELRCEVEKLDNDLMDREHKVLEMEGELELMNVRLEELCLMKESLIEVLNVYSEALDNDGTVNETITSDLEELQRRQKLDIERLSQIKETAIKVEDFSQQLHTSNEEKRNLEGKLAELESSVEGEKALLEEQIEETRKSMLNEKRLVIELESKVNFEVKRREAVETELRRVLVEREGEKSSNIEGELRKELLKEKAAKEQLNKQNEILLREKEECECTINDLKETAERKNSEYHRLQLEVSRMKDHVEAAVDKEDVSHALNGELAALKEKYQLAEKEFQERLELYVKETERLKSITNEMQEEQEIYERNINELKTAVELKESEIRNVENEYRKELQNKQVTNRQLDNRIEDLVKEREELERKINELCACAEKKDSELSRLKSGVSRMKEEGLDAMSGKDVSLISNTELEALQEKCQLAEKESEERLEIFFKETERLKGIIDEMQEEQEEFERKINELQQFAEQKDSKILLLESELAQMKEDVKTASNKMDVSLVSNKELDDLKEKCQLAEKESKESLELYFRETDRLKAIIDEMQEEQEEYIRQLDELKETAGQKESVIAKLKLEISEVVKQRKVKETVDPARNVNEEELTKVKGELSGAQLRVSQLEYDLFKLRELHDQETKRLAKEVECGNEKARNLKLEIRKLREFGSEDTIYMMRGQAHPSKQAKRGSDGDDEAGVVSNVAVYSLKAKLGKLEGEAEKLNGKIHQLEKEKSTLALLNTETSNKVAQLTSDNNLLKAQKKKLFEELQRFKKLQENSLPREEDAADASDRSFRNLSVLGVSKTENVSIQPTKEKKSVADYKAKQTEKTDNWLEGATVFQEEPNQCTHQ